MKSVTCCFKFTNNKYEEYTGHSAVQGVHSNAMFLIGKKKRVENALL